MKVEEISYSNAQEMIRKHVGNLDSVITMDFGHQYRCRLPVSCSRHKDESHAIRILFNQLRTGNYLCAKLKAMEPNEAFKRLSKKFLLPQVVVDIFERVVLTRKFFHPLSDFLVKFNVCSIKSQLKAIAAQLSSYLKALLLVVYRTEDFCEEVKQAILNKCAVFFSSTKVDTGEGFKSLEMKESLNVLMSSNVDNFSTQLSTGNSYALNMDYGCTYTKEIH